MKLNQKIMKMIKELHNNNLYDKYVDFNEQVINLYYKRYGKEIDMMYLLDCFYHVSNKQKHQELMFYYKQEQIQLLLAMIYGFIGG